ncbi:MAG: hypothetical protein HYT15_04425 [Candidatus Magasanikbacteria bacterium]|nr:hypothetical protein [Candidatus Magasanikbacteria bacterium]
MVTPALLAKPTYWFVLGRESKIAAAEIAAILNFKKHTYASTILKIQDISFRERLFTSEMTLDPSQLMRRLGGTIKIAKELAVNITEQQMNNLIREELKTISGKINFGISIYRENQDKYADLKLATDIGKKIKRSLKDEGFSVRYVENREPILSSVTVEKNNLTGRGREFLIQKNINNTFSVAKTEAVQPFEDFSARDFGRPGRDDISGMLPPKLAMIMINLAQAPLEAVIMDPFCGSGTILSEALLMGYTNVIGTDISKKAILDTKKNIDWITAKFNISTNESRITIEQKDAEEIGAFVPPASVSSIIAEPYMGKPLKGRETKEELLLQANELKKLYVSAFAQFYKILQPGGVAVFLIPRFKYQSEWITINCQKEIEGLGFKLLPFFEDNMPLIYARPDQRVAREIWRFKKV